LAEQRGGKMSDLNEMQERGIAVVKIGSSTLDDPEGMAFFMTTVWGIARRFGHMIVVVGGGKLSRERNRYLHLWDRDVAEEKRDLVGILATRYHAECINVALGIRGSVWTEEPTIQRIKDFLDCRHQRIQIVSGWYSGTSSDGPAVMLADKCGVPLIKIGTPVKKIPRRVEITPDVVKNAETIHAMNWREYSIQFPCHREPSGHAPIDEESASLAERYGLTVAIGDWRDLYKSLDRFMENGTVIAP